MRFLTTTLFITCWLLSFQSEAQVISFCQPATDTIQLTPSSPAGGSWSSNCGSCVDEQGVFNPAGLLVGSYQVLYQQSGGSDTFLISIFPQLVISATGQDSADVKEAVSLAASGGVNYTWTPSGSLSCGDCANPIFTADTTTIFTVTGTDANGCSDTTTLTINVRPEIKFDMPNAFTPNGDQANDLFRPVFKGAIFKEYHLYVYDRWGERVFETYTPGDGWDGKVFELPVMSDVYVYVFEYELVNGEKGVDKNQVTLLR